MRLAVEGPVDRAWRLFVAEVVALTTYWSYMLLDGPMRSRFDELADAVMIFVAPPVLLALGALGVMFVSSRSRTEPPNWILFWVAALVTASGVIGGLIELLFVVPFPGVD